MTDFSAYKGRNLSYFAPKFGCDPEFFFAAADGNVIGSEKVLTVPLKSDTYSNASRSPVNTTTRAFVQDGVQVELNPTPNTCRANLGNEIAAAFRTLREHLRSVGNVTASFKQVVEVSQAELDSLSEKAKALGCAPSHNAYDKKASVTVDGSVYRKRSAGGHIHLGLSDWQGNPSLIMQVRERLVPLLDIIVGNTAVLIDRDPANAERRKVYGRAGEYRLPAHGLEYRTLSNFWLRDYKLMHGMLGLCRLTTSLLNTQLLHDKRVMRTPYDTALMTWPAEEKLLSLVDLEKVRRAINENDLSLAWANFQAIRPFIVEHCHNYSLSNLYLPAFDYFLDGIDAKGIEYWFPDNPIDSWADMLEGHDRGWESFMQSLRYKIPSSFSYAGPVAAVAATAEATPPPINIQEVRAATQPGEVRNEIAGHVGEVAGAGAEDGNLREVAARAAAEQVVVDVQADAAVARRAAASARAATRKRDRSGRFAPGTREQ